MSKAPEVTVRVEITPELSKALDGVAKRLTALEQWKAGATLVIDAHNEVLLKQSAPAAASETEEGAGSAKAAVERWICNRCDLAWFSEIDAKTHASQDESMRTCGGATYSHAVLDTYVTGFVDVTNLSGPSEIGGKK